MMDRRRADPPVVTGLSPKEGISGTQVTIRGENLGVTQADIVGLTICGVDCLMSARWESSRKMVARVGLAKGGVGDVIVTTRSGGRGTSTVQFRVFNIQIGPLEESAVWVDESRSAPGLQRDVTSSVTTALVDDDPLGIGNGERKDPRVPDSMLSELFPDGSGNLRLENFVPMWYLLQHHKSATFDDLKSAVPFMQRHGVSLREGPLDFLKSNLNSSINCVDALAALHETLEKDRGTKGWPLTQKLLVQTVSCRSDADFLFTEVLNRKERADATRNALSVLQRFKFLFYLPSNIDRNVAKGTYAAIFNDYTRAKSLFTETEVPLFKEVFVEVEKRMNQFREALKQRLVEMPANLEEQKKIIRYLLILEPDSDAGWDCLSADNKWLQEQLWSAQEKHFKAERSSSLEAGLDLEEKLEIPQRFLFVDSVSAILTGRVQQFLRLSQAYVAGHLSAKANLHKEGQVEAMVRGLVHLASTLLVNAVLPETVSSDVRKQHDGRLVRWPIGSRDDTMNLMQSLKTLRSTVATLLHQEFLGKHIEPLYELCVILRMKCLGRVLEQANRGIYDLQQRENWKVQISEKGYAKTLLPDQFESLVSEIIPVIKQILACGGYPGEIDLFTIDKRRDSILQSFESLLTSFKETLEQLARIPAAMSNAAIGVSSSPISVTSTTSRRPSVLVVSGAASETKTKETPVKDRKLLIVLGNCDYALRYTLPSLINRLKHGGLQATDRVLERCRSIYAAFRNLLLKMYIDAKCCTFSDLIDPVEYTKVNKVNDVSNYIKDLVLCIVSVQAELFLVAAHFTPQVMSFTVRHCCDRLIAHAKRFHNVSLSKLAATQMYLDLSAFELTVKHFMAPETKSLLVEAKSHFEKCSHSSLVEEKLGDYQKRMKLTILSLQPVQSAAA